MLRELNPMAVLAAKDLQRARAFYHSMLGLDPSEEMMGQLMYSAPSGTKFLSEGNTLCIAQLTSTSTSDATSAQAVPA